MKRPRLGLLFTAAQLGSAVNLLVPVRAGEAVRVRIISQRSGIPASSLVGTIFGEIISDLASFAAYVILGLLLLKEARFLWPLAVACAILVVAGGAGAYYLSGRVERWPEPGAIAQGARLWFDREIYNFAKGLQSFREPGVILQVNLASQGIWLFEVLAFYACGRALGLDLSLGAYLLLLVVANVAGSVPVTQAGFGTFEVTLTGVIVALGPSQAQAAAYAIFLHVLLTLPHIITGPIAAAILRISPASIIFGEAATADESARV